MLNGWRRSASRLALGAFFLLTLGACGCALPGSEKSAFSRFVAERSPRDTAKVSTEAVTPESLTATVYIDQSQSMQGYCGGAGSRYGEVLEHLVSGLIEPRILGFGVNVGGRQPQYLKVVDTHELRARSFYRALSNPDAELYRRIAADKASALSLYVSDGVQSAANSANLQPTNDALEALFHRGFGIAVLVYRANFDGRVWSESQGRFTARQTIGDRPFYVFAVARRPEILEYWLEKRLSSEIRPEYVFRFGPSALTLTTHLPKKSNQRFALDIPNTYAPERSKQTKWTSPQVQTICSYRFDSPRGATPSANLIPECPIEAWGRLGRKGLEDSAARPPFEIAINSTDSTLQLRYPNPGVRRTPGIVEIEARPRLLALSPEVQALSTENDSAESSKTYRFAWLIERLVQAQLDHHPIRTRIFVSL